MNTPKPLPSVSALEKSFVLKGGVLYWYLDPDKPKWWNTRFAKKRAGNHREYSSVRCGGVSYLVHRLIFKMVHGYDPNIIDHKNRNPRVNHPHNLWDGTLSTNQHNRKRSRNNTSGISGVFFSHGKWRGRVYLNSKATYVKPQRSKRAAAFEVKALRKQLHGVLHT